MLILRKVNTFLSKIIKEITSFFKVYLEESELCPELSMLKNVMKDVDYSFTTFRGESF